MHSKYGKDEKNDLYTPTFADTCPTNNIAQTFASEQEYVLNLMMFSDQVCARELRSLSANQRTLDAAFTTSSTIFSSVASIVSGTGAKDILSVLSTTTGATGDHVNASVYRNAQAEFITRLIQADRVRIAKEIKQNSADAAKYGRQRAIFDANQYHQACSLFHGLSLLADAADEKAEELEKTDADKNSQEGKGEPKA